MKITQPTSSSSCLALENVPQANAWILSRAHAFILVSHVSGSEFVSCIAARMKPVTLPTPVSPFCAFLSFHLNGAKSC